jgi:predicted deacylase
MAGPVVGVTAAIHGNELNGIMVIHRLLREIVVTGLRGGAVVAVPIVNVPGYLRQQREFEDGTDLNRIMPGKDAGNESALYAYRFMDRVVAKFDYLIDLHTASTGRENSLYVRADMDDEKTATMARLISPQIVLHSPGADGTLRGAAQRRGIRAITVEVGDPQRLQRGLVRSARLGLQEVLENLGMLPDSGSEASPGGDAKAIECRRSYWMHTDRGGVLTVLPSVAARVQKGDLVARMHNVWGDLVREYHAPEAGVIIGRSVNPCARAGSRVVHLGMEE